MGRCLTPSPLFLCACPPLQKATRQKTKPLSGAQRRKLKRQQELQMGGQGMGVAGLVTTLAHVGAALGLGSGGGGGGGEGDGSGADEVGGRQEEGAQVALAPMATAKQRAPKRKASACLSHAQEGTIACASN